MAGKPTSAEDAMREVAGARRPSRSIQGRGGDLVVATAGTLSDPSSRAMSMEPSSATSLAKSDDQRRERELRIRRDTGSAYQNQAYVKTRLPATIVAVTVPNKTSNTMKTEPAMASARNRIPPAAR